MVVHLNEQALYQGKPRISSLRETTVLRWFATRAAIMRHPGLHTHNVFSANRSLSRDRLEQKTFKLECQ
jgi:hypothetical protein